MTPQELLARKEFITHTLRMASPLLLEAYTPVPGADKRRSETLSTSTKKSDADLVTLYDKKVEEFLIESLQKQFPGECIIGEESTAASGLDPRLQAQGKDLIWILDPIDGTTNFSRAYPFYCSTIALAEKTSQGFEVVLGATWQPVSQEMFWAAKGQGAWLNRDRMQVTAISDPKKALFTTGFASLRALKDARAFDLFKKITLQSLGVRRDGSAALDLAYVAAGRIDAYWEWGLSCWDTATGILLVQEAGGLSSHHNEDPIDLFSGEVLASNGALHKWLSKELST